jgi:predicted 2-oxoglutarate/Fe(II)-dependent dioxygenase YbiX
MNCSVAYDILTIVAMRIAVFAMCIPIVWYMSTRLRGVNPVDCGRNLHSVFWLRSLFNDALRTA